MHRAKFRLNSEKILIVKLRYIGDTISILPVVENINEKAPAVTVDVIVNIGTEEIITNHPGIRRTWVYDRNLAKKNLFSSLSYHKNLIRRLRLEKYDFVIDFNCGDRSSFIAFMTGASQRISYQGCSRLSRILMNNFVELNPLKHHVVDYQLESLRLFGMDNFGRSMELHIPKSAEAKVDDFLAKLGINQDPRKIVIHPGAGKKLRQWQPEKYAQIAHLLRSRYNASIMLIGGPGDKHLVESVEKHMGFEASFRSNQLSLPEMAALFSRCHLFIGSDSGPGHIAAAAGCPTLTLFGPTFPHLWRPLSPVGEVVFKNLACSGCSQEEKLCIRPHNTCMDAIGVEEVWAEVERMLPH